MRRLLCLGLFAAVLTTWCLLFRPLYLGGSAGYVLVAGSSMLPTLHNGDLVVTRAEHSYRVGDVVAYRIPRGDPAAGHRVIHRIIGGSAAAGYVVQGDNKPAPDLWRPRRGDIIGRQWLTVPAAGRAIVLLRLPIVLAGGASLFALFLLFGGSGGQDAVSGHRP